MKDKIAHALRWFPIRINKGISKGNFLFGDFFYNRRSSKLTEEEEFFMSLDLENKTILEVGAFIGIYTLFFSKVAKKVIAIEPNPISFRFLKLNMLINRRKNVIPLNIGIGSSEEILDFYVSYTSPARSTFVDRKKRLEKLGIYKKVKIPVSSVDSLMEKLNERQLDFVKIDVEGFEYDVLQGMKRTLIKFKPIIYLEIHGLDEQEAKRNFKLVESFASKFNYTMQSVGKPRISLTGGYVLKPNRNDL